MARTTVTIPDDLMQELEPYKDQINESVIVADALRKELRRLKAPADLGDLTATVERMRANYEKYEKSNYQMGFEAGATWARDQAGYLELKSYASVEKNYLYFPTTQERQRYDQWLLARGYGTQRNARPSDTIQDYDKDGYVVEAKAPFDDSAYRHGWRDGATSVWEAIEDKLIS